MLKDSQTGDFEEGHGKCLVGMGALLLLENPPRNDGFESTATPAALGLWDHGESWIWKLTRLSQFEMTLD